MTFRKPVVAPLIDIDDLRPAIGDHQRSPSVATSDDHVQVEQEELKRQREREEREAVQIHNEECKMYFYYPKYLHPEAVALLAQNLLQDWETKAKRKYQDMQHRIKRENETRQRLHEEEQEQREISRKPQQQSTEHEEQPHQATKENEVEEEEGHDGER